MRLRDGAVVAGIIIGAFWVHHAYAAAGLKNGGDAGKGDSGTAQPRLVPKGGEQAIKNTGGTPGATWAADRYARSVAYLTNHGIDAATAREMSLSALAHWAIEAGAGDWTTAGSHEFNFNLAGIHARDGDQFFKSTDAGVPSKFAAYDNADQGVGDYWALLNAQYADCLKQLHDSPTTDAWIRCLGNNGYYDKTKIDTYASGMLIRRKQFASDASIHGDGPWVDEMYEHSALGDDFDGDERINPPLAQVVGGGSKSYGPYAQDTIDDILSHIRSQGMSLTGSNPWTISPNQHGIVLSASYNADTQLVTVVISSKNFYVGDQKIWDKLDAVMPAPTH